MDRFRHDRQAILDEAGDLIADIVNDLAHAPQPLNDDWTEQRKTLHSIGNSNDVPVFLKVLGPTMRELVKNRNAEPAAPVFNVLVIGDGTKSVEEWKKAAREMDAIDATAKLLPPKDEEIL